MKIIDKNGKLFSKISILDIIIVIVVGFLLVTFIINSKNKPVSISQNREEIKYTVTLKAYNNYKVERSPFNIGDAIYGQDGEYIGKIVDLKSRYTDSFNKLEDGTYIYAENSDYTDYYLTVEGTGTKNDKGIFAGGSIALIPCNSININSKLFSGFAVVLSVEKNA